MSSGRTGRAGRPGKAITFFTEDDATNLRRCAIRIIVFHQLYENYWLL